LHPSTSRGFICRASTNVASHHESAEDVIKQQLEFNVQLPKAKTWCVQSLFILIQNNNNSRSKTF